MGRFVKVCRSLKVNADKSKGIMLNGEERLECQKSEDELRMGRDR